MFLASFTMEYICWISLITQIKAVSSKTLKSISKWQFKMKLTECKETLSANTKIVINEDCCFLYCVDCMLQKYAGFHRNGDEVR